MNKNYMKVKIIGAGGFAMELAEYIEDNNRHLEEKILIEGFFDFDDKLYNSNQFNAPFLGSEKDYNFTNDDNVLIAIGDLETRNKVIDYLNDTAVNIISFVHHSSIIASSSNIGKGTIICPFCIVGAMTKLGDYNLINYQCAIPHNCTVGDRNVFSPNVQVTGYTKIGSNNFFGVSTGTMPSIVIGNNNKVQAGLLVTKNIENNSIVFSIQKIKTMEMYK